MADIVVSRLTGGLGNQLFQYAAGVSIARASGALLALDVSGFPTDKDSRVYGLDRYELGLPVIDGTSFEPDFGHALIPAQPALECLGGALRLTVVREDNYEFDPAIASLRGSFYLYGHWQSWKYFSAATDEIRSRLKPLPRGGLLPLPHIRDMLDGDAVAVHVRRSDYLKPEKQDVFGWCERGYYRSAVALMRERIRNPKFLVFSDDVPWCREHFTDPDTAIVSTAGGDARDDLAVMARCRHHIIANSSLSWWGAWLGEAENSVVVAPIPWYTQSPRASDLIPEHWIRLDRSTGARWPSGQAGSRSDTVSVVIAAGKRPDALRRAVQSARSQSHRNIEIVIALGEPGPEISVEAGHLTREDASTRVVRAPRCGVAAARNAGIASAQGEWIAFIDEGDEWLSDKLAIQIEAACLSGADAVSCRSIPVEGPRGLPELFPPPGPPDCSLQDLLTQGYVMPGMSHVLVRRGVLARVGGFDEMSTSCEADEFWRRLTRQTRTILLWTRLFKSPVPFVARTDRAAD